MSNSRNNNKKYDDHMPAGSDAADPYARSAGFRNYNAALDRTIERDNKNARQNEAEKRAEKQYKFVNPKTWKDITAKFASHEWLHSPVMPEVSRIYTKIKDAADVNQISSAFIKEINEALSDLFNKVQTEVGNIENLPLAAMLKELKIDTLPQFKKALTPLADNSKKELPAQQKSRSTIITEPVQKYNSRMVAGSTDNTSGSSEDERQECSGRRNRR